MKQGQQEDVNDVYNSQEVALMNYYNVDVHHMIPCTTPIQFNCQFCQNTFSSNNKLHKHVHKDHKKPKPQLPITDGSKAEIYHNIIKSDVNHKVNDVKPKFEFQQ